MGDITVAGLDPNLRANAPFPLGHRSSAKRCLFGVPDPLELKLRLEKDTQRLYERDKTKWNFDFMAEEPLDGGRYSWKKIRLGDDDPSKSSESSSCEHERVQTHITDYMRKRKSSNQTSSKPST